VTGGQGRGDSEQVGDGAPSIAQQGGASEGRSGERRGDGPEDRQGLIRYNHRGASLAVAGGARLLPLLPPGRASRSLSVELGRYPEIPPWTNQREVAASVSPSAR